MKVAFTSCFRAKDGDEQPVWAAIQRENPQVLLLLGDCIYMDYFPKLGRPRKWCDEKFARKMYAKYVQQASDQSFVELASSVEAVGAIWDDHDFAWNNCYGGAGGKDHVPTNKRLIAKGLRQQFVDWLQTGDGSTQYPTKPTMDSLLAAQDTGIEEFFDHGGVRFILTDGRYYREEVTDGAKSSLLGSTQRSWMEAAMDSAQGLCVICSGSTLTSGGESWEEYFEFEWLRQHRPNRAIVLSGDIHKNRLKKHDDLGGLIEAISSGAHRPGIGGAKGNFGVLDISEQEVGVSLFDKNGLEMAERFVI